MRFAGVRSRVFSARTICRSEIWLLHHQRSPRCPDGGFNSFRVSLHKLKGSHNKVVTPVYMSAVDMMKRAVGRSTTIRRVRDASQPSTAAEELMVVLAMESETTTMPMERNAATKSDGKYTLMDGAAFDCAAVSVGMCMKGKRSNVQARYTAAQLQFLSWCYNRGVEHKANKMSARTAEELMVVHGTGLGERMHPNNEYWEASSSGRPTFRISELLEHHTFRSWFSQQKQAFSSKMAKAVTVQVNSMTELLGSSSNIEEEDAGDGDDE